MYLSNISRDIWIRIGASAKASFKIVFVCFTV